LIVVPEMIITRHIHDIFRDVLQELANKLARHNFHHIPGFKGEIQEA
jgi:hypothetical protein